MRKQTRKGDGYSEAVEIYQEPTVENPYTKSINLLTSGDTASAAKIFAITMRTSPHVILVGETTEGILSDVLVSTLPNSWTVGRANEMYTTANDEAFESVEFAPTVTDLFLDPEYEANQQDAALEAVLAGFIARRIHEATGKCSSGSSGRPVPREASPAKGKPRGKLKGAWSRF